MKNEKFISPIFLNNTNKKDTSNKDISNKLKRKILKSINKLKNELIESILYLKNKDDLINEEDIKRIINDIYKQVGFSSKVDLNSDVEEMLGRARRNLEPQNPYISSHHKSVLDFIKEAYSDYLKYFGAKENLIFLNHLGLIHPNKYANRRVLERINKLEKQKLKKPLSQVKENKLEELKKIRKIFQSPNYNEKYGEDVRQSLINYCRRNRINLSDIIKTGKKGN